MNARLAGAALWVAAGCLPQSDDLGAYSAEWAPPRAAAAPALGGAAGGSVAAGGGSGAPASGSGSAGSDGVGGGDGVPLDGGGSAPGSGAGGASIGVGEGGAPGDAGAAGPCADGVLASDGSRCYRVSLAGAAWQDARDECLAWPGQLVKVETPEEDAFLSALLTASMWLGASDTEVENVFVWTDGAPVEYGNWGPNQPDRYPGPDCIEKRDTVGRYWFDQPCFNARAFVCERVVEH